MATYYLSDKAETLARSCARGSFQDSLLETWSDWTLRELRGRAKTYSGRYRESRDNLLRRLEQAGLVVRWATKYRAERNFAGRVRMSRERVAIIGLPEDDPRPEYLGLAARNLQAIAAYLTAVPGTRARIVEEAYEEVEDLICKAKEVER